MIREEVISSWKELKGSITTLKEDSENWFDLKVEVEIIVRNHTNLPTGSSNENIIKALKKLVKR